MMAQGELGFKYEVEHQGEGMTGMGGIGPYLDLACRSGMVRSIERHVKARGEQGWTDAESVLSLVMLNLVGGDCVRTWTGLNRMRDFVDCLARR